MLLHHAGSMRAYFRGNGANVVKIAPETALKLTLNDSLKHWLAQDPDHIRASERMLSGGIAGAVAQVRGCGGAVCVSMCRPVQVVLGAALFPFTWQAAALLQNQILCFF